MISNEVIQSIIDRFDPKVILLPIAAKKKGPGGTIMDGWPLWPWEHTQTPEYQQMLRTLGNIGVRFDQKYATFDIDNNEDIAPICERYPELNETLWTTGKGYGAQVWMKIVDNIEGYEFKRKVLKQGEKGKLLEFRSGNKHQSVIYGEHENSTKEKPVFYKILIDRPIIEVRAEVLKRYIRELDTVSKPQDDSDYEWTQEDAFKNCNFRTLNLIELLKKFHIHVKLEDKESGKYGLRCPWHQEHSNPSHDSLMDTAIWQRMGSGEWPAFKCLHAHCDGRTLEHLLLWAEEQMPGITERHCKLNIIQNKTSVKKCYDHVIHADDCLLGKRWLCRGGSMFVIAPSGVGKSVFAMQAAIEWGMGRPSFGIYPNGCLKSLIIQCEDDMGDLKEHTSIMKSWTEAERCEVGERVYIVTEYSRYKDFASLFPLYLERDRPDIIWLNPYSAYSPPVIDDGANIEFLVSLLSNCAKYNCALMCIHHIPKSVLRNTEVWNWVSYAYAGAGSSVLTSIPRGNMAIEPTKDAKIFKFFAAKRGKRIGWDTNEKYFAHSEVEGNYFWLPAEAPNVDTVSKEKPESNGGSVGQPPKYTAQQILDLLVDGMSNGQWKEEATTTLKMSTASFDRKVKELKIAGRLKIVNGRYFVV